MHWLRTIYAGVTHIWCYSDLFSAAEKELLKRRRLPSFSSTFIKRNWFIIAHGNKSLCFSSSAIDSEGYDNICGNMTKRVINKPTVLTD